MPERAVARPKKSQQAMLNAFLDELSRWNSRINLTSVRRDEAWLRHVEETLQLIRVAEPAPAARVIDVGSGNGVPGVVIAVMRPDLLVTLAEADQRKVGFLHHVAGRLQLTNVSVLPGRAEQAAHRHSWRGHFDLAVSRATAPPPVLCELTLPFVAVDGSLCALVSDAHAAVREAARSAALLGGGEPAAFGDHVLTVRKLRPTDDRFPRSAGAMRRHPLN